MKKTDLKAKLKQRMRHEHPYYAHALWTDMDEELGHGEHPFMQFKSFQARLNDFARLEDWLDKEKIDGKIVYIRKEEYTPLYERMLKKLRTPVRNPWL